MTLQQIVEINNIQKASTADMVLIMGEAQSFQEDTTEIWGKIRVIRQLQQMFDAEIVKVEYEQNVLTGCLNYINYLLGEYKRPELVVFQTYILLLNNETQEFSPILDLRFTQLLDTPNVIQPLQKLRGNAAGTALEFYEDIPSIGNEGSYLIWNQDDADAGDYDENTFVSHEAKIWKSRINNNTVEPSLVATDEWEAQSVETLANAVLLEDILTNFPAGAIPAGTLLPIGSSLTQLFKKLTQTIFFPTLGVQSFSLSNNIGTVEVGSAQNVQLTFNYTRGNIVGALVSGVWNPSTFQNFRGGAAISYLLNGTSQAGNVLTVTGYVATLGTNSFTGSVTYGIGAQPTDSAGANFSTPLAAGTSATQSTSFAAAYKFFYGVGSIATNSAQVRALANNTFSTSFQLIFAPGQTQASFSYPASRADIVDSSVKYVEGFNANVGNTFTKSLFNVNDAGGNPIAYKTYTVELPAPEAGQVTYNVTLP